MYFYDTYTWTVLAIRRISLCLIKLLTRFMEKINCKLNKLLWSKLNIHNKYPYTAKGHLT